MTTLNIQHTSPCLPPQKRRLTTTPFHGQDDDKNEKLWRCPFCNENQPGRIRPHYYTPGCKAWPKRFSTANSSPTLPKINMEPENGTLEWDDVILEPIIFRFHVKLWECIFHLYLSPTVSPLAEGFDGPLVPRANDKEFRDKMYQTLAKSDPKHAEEFNQKFRPAPPGAVLE